MHSHHNVALSSPICNLHPTLLISADLLSLLSKGLTFIPSPISEPNATSLNVYVEKFLRKIEWSSFFHFKNRGEKPPFSLSNNSHPPSKNIPPLIVQLSSDIKSLVSNLHTPVNTSISFNLSIEERNIISFLKKDPSIIIHPADKGGKIVIQHRDNYILEAFRQLNDTNAYKQIDTPIFAHTAKMIKRIVNNLHHQGYISKSQLRFLTPPLEPRQRHFYILPKIHKPSNTWTIPNLIPPGRPIVSGCNSESAAVEHFIDYHLQPIASSSPSFIRDTSHFKAIISNTCVNDSDFFVTLDVESLYTSIPINEGIECIRQSFNNHPQTKRPDNYIIKLLEITLFRNDFQFFDKTFLQIKGTAMGKKYAPSFANIYMHFWELNALSLSHLKPSLWKRYIDDIFCIWPYSLSKLNSFIEHLNSINPNIKITAIHNKTQIDFLDCTIFKSSNNICTKIFFKESTNLQLLNPKSYHPSHTFKGIIKAQILRYIRLSSTYTDFQHSYKTLKHSLLQIGYSRSLLRNCKSLSFNCTACSTESMITGCKRCDNYRCHICTHINTTRSIQGNAPNCLHLITQNTNCNTRNCIYTIHCTLCSHISTLYVGETKKACRDRINQHFSDIRLHKNTPVSLHFNLPNHNIDHMKVTVIQFFTSKHFNTTTIDNLRKNKECLWIKKLKTYTPVGLNTKTQIFSSFIPLTLPFNKTSTAIVARIKSHISKKPELKDNIFILPSYSNNINLQKLLAPTKFV